MVAAKLKHHVDVVGVLEDVVEGHHVAVLQRLVNLDLGDQLRGGRSTFCLALLFLSVSFETIFMAVARCDSRLSTSKHFAKPPLPRNRFLRYCRTTGLPPLKPRYSMISGAAGALPVYFAYIPLRL